VSEVRESHWNFISALLRRRTSENVLSLTTGGKSGCQRRG
jgi:hypothetical protein